MTDTKKKIIPVPVERCLKNFFRFLMLVKEDLVCGLLGSMATQERDSPVENHTLDHKRAKMVDQLQLVATILPKYMTLTLEEHTQEQELVELVKAAQSEMTTTNFIQAQTRWVELLLDKVSDILEATQHLNLERLTKLMERNDTAGAVMEGKDTILILGSPGCGKTTTLHYLAGTTFRATSLGKTESYRPVTVVHPEATRMKIANHHKQQHGKEVITRHLQVAEIIVDDKAVVLCDAPSFGNHESLEEIIANSLGLIRAIRRAKTVRPIICLSRDEIGHRNRFHAYPQILTILVRLLGSDSNVNLEPFRFVFTKYNNSNAETLQKQLTIFLQEAEAKNNDDKNGANRYALIRHLLESSCPKADVIIPTKGNPQTFLKTLMESSALVMHPNQYFVPNMPEAVMTQLKRQLKFTLVDLRDALARNDNGTAIHRMQQMSKLANLLPEAGIYARHGFKAFKEVINTMVEGSVDDDDLDDDTTEDGSSLDDEESLESFDDSVILLNNQSSSDSWMSSAESVQWSNVSSKLTQAFTNDSLMVARQLSIISEEDTEVEIELDEDGMAVIQESLSSSSDIPREKTSPSPALLELVSKCAALNKELEKRKATQQEAETASKETEMSPTPDIQRYASMSPASMSPLPVPQPRSGDSPRCMSPTPPTPVKRPVCSPPPGQLEMNERFAISPPPQESTEKPAQQQRKAPTPEDPVHQQKTQALPIKISQERPQPTDSEVTQEQPQPPPTDSERLDKCDSQCKSPNPEVQQPTQQVPPPENMELLPDEDLEYAEQSSSMLKEMVTKAIEDRDYNSAIQRMQEYVKLCNGAPAQSGGGNADDFKNVVELFLVFAIAIEQGNYSSSLNHMKQLISLSESGHLEAGKCSQLAVQIAIDHVSNLRERVVRMTGQLHMIEDPDDFDRVLEQLRKERTKVDQSNILLEACMRGSDDRGKSETVLSCISYGFKVGRLSR